jgi:hypothetical protein
MTIDALPASIVGEESAVNAGIAPAIWMAMSPLTAE